MMYEPEGYIIINKSYLERWFVDEKTLKITMIEVRRVKGKIEFINSIAEGNTPAIQLPTIETYILKPQCNECKKKFTYADGVVICEKCDKVINDVKNWRYNPK